MKLLAVFLVLTAFVALYVVWLRPWLRDKPWAAGFFAKIESVEILFYKKSESILWARFLQLMGAVLAALASLGSLDLTPLFPFLPDKYKWVPGALPLVVTVAGWMQEKMRKDTSKPLEVVAMPESPAKAEVVEKIEEANAEGKIAAVIEAEKV